MQKSAIYFANSTSEWESYYSNDPPIRHIFLCNNATNPRGESGREKEYAKGKIDKMEKILGAKIVCACS